MTMDTTNSAPTLAARDLRAAMRGKVLLPSDADYVRARQIWSGSACRYPAIIAQCEGTQDVQAAVRIAQAHHLPLSVRGGGHDWAGRALRHNGLVIDLTAMRHVEVDAGRQIATVAGGALARDVVVAAAGHGLVAVTGNCGGVGMAGLTLGGGYGLLSPRHGLAVDNLLGAQVVLADGRSVTADVQQNPELLWALRGGGGNFGVVTSMRVRLHPARALLAGLMLFPWQQAAAVLHGYAAIVESAPDELAVLAGVLSTPDGEPALFLAPVWSGDPQEGTQRLAELEGLGTPMHVQLGPMAFGDLLAMFDAHVVHGRHYAIRTRWLPRLTPAAIEHLIAASAARSSPFSMIALHHLHGAATRVAPASTAFGLRQDHYMLEVIAAWDRGAEDGGTLHRRWAQDLSQALAPHGLAGGYANMLGPDDIDQIPFAYGANAARLLAAKRRFDPDGVFSAIPLPR
ncbi:MAG: FAD-binding oxidoreductase [Acetobacteraceae bacterium]